MPLQASSSGHSVPSGAFACAQPVSGLQVSVEQGFPSPQVLWKTQPVPGQTLFRRMGNPAHDVERYPVTRDILARSLVGPIPDGPRPARS